MSGFKSITPSGFAMGNFATASRRLTSEERFVISRWPTHGTSPGSSTPPGWSGPVIPTNSQCGLGSKPTRTKQATCNRSNAANAVVICSAVGPPKAGSLTQNWSLR